VIPTRFVYTRSIHLEMTVQEKKKKKRRKCDGQDGRRGQGEVPRDFISLQKPLGTLFVVDHVGENLVCCSGTEEERGKKKRGKKRTAHA